MNGQTVEDVVRIRIPEPPDDAAIRPLRDFRGHLTGAAIHERQRRAYPRRWRT
jgi:hypothetical protein